MKKMIVTDLDGTLLDSNRECSNKNIKYLRLLKSKGYTIVIATGRILSSAISKTKGASFADYIIADAGSVIYDVNNKKILFKRNIENKTIEKIFSLYDEKIISSIDVCDIDNYHTYTTSREEKSYSKKIEDIDLFLKQKNDVTHMTIFFYEDNKVDDFLKRIIEEIPEIDYHVMKDYYILKRSIELSVKGVTKYTAIRIVAEIENIVNEDIIAFGDSFNDMDMIKNCGIGIAMGNAMPELKQVAKYVTKTNDENGIIYFLEEYFKNINKEQ